MAGQPEAGTPIAGPRGPGRLLVVGAHAFDAEAMAGALVATWARQGGAACLLHVSMGEAGHQAKARQSYAAQKRAEAEAAARTLGAEVRFLGHPDTEVGGVAGLAAELALAVQELRPGTVVTHWRGSWHPDHVATHHAVLKGLVLAGLGKGTDRCPPHSPGALLYGENWEDAEGFRPLEYRDVSDGFETWTTALACYEIGGTAPPGFPYRDYYTAMARARGCLYGAPYAEAFFPATPEVMAGLGPRRPVA